MPNNRNAAKAARQAEKRRLRNRIARTSLKSVLKKTRDVVAKGEAPAVAEALNDAASKLDRAATKKFIHRNKAARLKSRLAALAAKKKAAPVAVK